MSSVETEEYEGKGNSLRDECEEARSPGIEQQEEEATAAELRLQLVDQRDQFLFEAEQLEDEILELRNMVASMQHSIDAADRRWKQERELKLQLEKQVMESIQIGTAISVRATAEPALPYPQEQATLDAVGEAMQPCTPPCTEDYEGLRERMVRSESGSAVEIGTPSSASSLKVSAPSNEDLALALEAQIELATLIQEHRTIVMIALCRISSRPRLKSPLSEQAKRLAKTMLRQSRQFTIQAILKVARGQM